MLQNSIDHKVDPKTAELISAACRAYGIEVRDFTPGKKEYLLYTNQGKKILRQFTEKRHFLYETALLHFLNENGFTNTLPLQETTLQGNLGKPYFRHQGKIFALFPLPLQGRPFDPGRVGDAKAVAKCLALFHRTSTGFRGLGGKKKKVWKDIPYSLNTYVEELEHLKNAVVSYSIDHDANNLFLDLVQKETVYGREALRLLQKNDYQELLLKSQEQKNLCFHHFTPEGIYMKEYHEPVFVDFHRTAYGPHIHDLADLLKAFFLQSNHNGELGEQILCEYCNLKPLTKNEMVALVALMLVPDLLWKLANQFYVAKIISLKEFLAELEALAAQEENRLLFIKNLPSLCILQNN